MHHIDFLTADRFSPLGDAPVLLVDAASWQWPRVLIGATIVGLDEAGTLPSVNAEIFDVLLTTASDPPAPWVQDDAAEIERAVRTNPFAAAILRQTLRIGSKLPFGGALAVMGHRARSSRGP